MRRRRDLAQRFFGAAPRGLKALFSRLEQIPLEFTHSLHA
jgi:hypothetical protein